MRPRMSLPPSLKATADKSLMRATLTGCPCLNVFPEQGDSMPFVNIRLIEGRSQQQKDELSRRVTDAISEVLQLPRDDTWVVFEDIPAEGWYVGGTTVAERPKKPPK